VDGGADIGGVVAGQDSSPPLVGTDPAGSIQPQLLLGMDTSQDPEQIHLLFGFVHGGTTVPNAIDEEEVDGQSPRIKAANKLGAADSRGGSKLSHSSNPEGGSHEEGTLAIVGEAGGGVVDVDEAAE